MSSFDKMAVWPVGYFRAFSSWILRNRRDIVAHIDTLNAEIARIGFITVVYRVEDVNGEERPTEERLGFKVTRGSSLGKLIQAYIANGGNPYDISSFMHPDGMEVVEEDAQGRIKTNYRYPHGGVVAPLSADYGPNSVEGDSTGYEQDRGGWLDTDRYYPARQKGRTDRGTFDSDSIVRYMHGIRKWANQAIKTRLQDIEWRIIKLCDLREQLTQERDDVLVQAFGGAMEDVGTFDEDRFSKDLRVQSLIQDMYVLLYETDASGSVRAFRANNDVSFLKFTFDDKPSEWRMPLGV